MRGHTWQGSVRSIDARDKRQNDNVQNVEETSHPRSGVKKSHERDPFRVTKTRAASLPSPTWLMGSHGPKRKGLYSRVWISVDGQLMLGKKRRAFAGRLAIALLSLKISPRDEIEQVYASTTAEASICPPSSREPSTPRGPVRRTVRPFIKEFKTRSAKSPATHPRPICDADNDGSKPSFLDLDVFSTPPNNSDDELKVALTAAHAVFGRGSPVAPLPDTSPFSKAPMGRVLPCLIGEDDPLPVRLTDGDGKSRHGRSAGKVESSLPIRRK
jgi:hypothetical protein